jgi:hypothetical protein
MRPPSDLLNNRLNETHNRDWQEFYSNTGTAMKRPASDALNKILDHLSLRSYEKVRIE